MSISSQTREESEWEVGAAAGILADIEAAEDRVSLMAANDEHTNTLVEQP